MEISVTSFCIAGFAIFLIGFVFGCVFTRLFARQFGLHKLIDRLTDAEVNEFLGGRHHTKHDECEDLLINETFRIDTKKIHVYEVLGTGKTGIVYRGTFRPPTSSGPVAVAIKTARHTSNQSQPCYTLADYITNDLEDEAKIVQKVGQHPHLVQFLGLGTKPIAGVERITAPFLVFELCAAGNLKDILHQINESRSLTAGEVSTKQDHRQHKQIQIEAQPTSLILWALQIVSAVEFLHSSNIIHRDIAARNILLFDASLVKLSDLGMARQLVKPDQKVYVYNESVPWRSCAVEIFSTFGGPFTIQSDVWAFGVTMWEIFSYGDDPYDGVSSPHELSRRLQDGVRLSQPVLASNQIYHLMSECWAADPAQRPSCTQLKEQLELLRSEIETPIK